MKLGLIGKSLIHSFSASYFKEKFIKDALIGHQYKNYELEELTETSLNDLLLQEKLNGFNVTIPYKEKVLSFIPELSEDAQQIGAVNTVKVNWIDDQTYSLNGYNTDWRGFLKSIRPFLTLHHQQALILGTGGAAKAIAYALKSLGIDYFYVSRNNSNLDSKILSYHELNQYAMAKFKLIVNTTPIGTYPATEEFPDIPYQYIGKDHLICDLVYNPTETKLMTLSKAKGAAVLNGLSMLQFQADEAWKIWTNKKGHSV